jgi:hypothetical protein
VPPRYDAAAHATVVADVHEELLHSTDSSSDADGVGSFEAKFSPLMATSTPPVCAAFAGLVLLTVGAAHARAKRLRMTAAFTRGDEVALLIRIRVDEEARQNPDRGLLHKPYAPKETCESNLWPGVQATSTQFLNTSAQTSGIDPCACPDFYARARPHQSVVLNAGATRSLEVQLPRCPQNRTRTCAMTQGVQAPQMAVAPSWTNGRTTAFCRAVQMSEFALDPPNRRAAPKLGRK